MWSDARSPIDLPAHETQAAALPAALVSSSGMKRGCAGLLHCTARLGDGVVKKGSTALVSFCFAVWSSAKRLCSLLCELETPHRCSSGRGIDFFRANQRKTIENFCADESHGFSVYLRGVF